MARYEAQDFHVGPVPDARFEFETPPDATVERPQPRKIGQTNIAQATSLERSRR